MRDFLIVGAGLFGATLAHCLTDAGRDVLVIEKRPHVGGNCADRKVDGVNVHLHGCHIFHTDNERVWQFVNRFANFWPYRHRVKASYQGRLYSFPINLMTLHQVFGVRTPEEAQRLILNNGHARHDNLRDWAVAEIGETLYGMFVEGYTTKQWGRPPEELPASIIRRLPIRLTYNGDYFDDRYQGIPTDGYSAMIGEMLRGIDVRTETDFLADRAGWMGKARHTVYSGPPDELFDYRHGALAYRSLRWEYEWHDGDYQGCATINYTGMEQPYTRVLEYRHFMDDPPENSVIAREYPQEWEPGLPRYYPVNDAPNNARYKRYAEEAKGAGITLGGRLGSYRYYDMHQVVGQGMAMAGRLAQ